MPPIFSKLNPFFGPARVLPRGNTRTRLCFRPSIETLEHKIVLANISGQWSGIITDYQSGYPSPVDKIVMKLTQTQNAVQGIVHIEFLHDPRYYVNFNISGNVYNVVGFTFTEGTVISQHGPNGGSWHNIGDSTLSIAAAGNSMAGMWATSKMFGSITVYGHTTSVLPDISMNYATITPNGLTVNAVYTISGNALASPGTIDYYWASGTSLSNKIGNAVPVQTKTAVGTYTASTSIASLGTQPANASYIIAVADSASADPAYKVVATPTPHISIISFAKNAASTPLTSNGDYDLTYQVSGNNLPNNLKPTLAVYWATDMTAASIIPNIPLVATSPLSLVVGTYMFHVHIAQLINPPANATNLVAVLDNNHVLPASEETNTVAAIGSLNSPLSFELQSQYQTFPPFYVSVRVPAPDASTREQRVFLWLRNYEGEIKATASHYHIDPVAIAGAIAWEALQNVHSSVKAYGPGKPHAYEISYGPSMAEEAESLGYLPKVSLLERISLLSTPEGSIKYIGAIMGAFADIEQKVRGSAAMIRYRPDFLTSLFNGISLPKRYIPGATYYSAPTDPKSPIRLGNATAYFAYKQFNNLGYDPNPMMGQWVLNNFDYLEKSITK